MRHALLTLVLVAGCASPLAALKTERPVTVANARFTIRSDGVHARDVHRIEEALSRSADGLAPWGGLALPVTVYVVGTHDDLEAAVGRRGYGWLRAWSRYDDVIFQAPSTWSSADEVVNQLVLHELTHCALFQASGDAETWAGKHIPLWFREGMAIVTAQQQRLYPSLEDTSRWLEHDPALDPFTDGERLSEKHAAEVYGLALHAFGFLEDSCGRERLRQLFNLMQRGADFETAFQQATSRSVGDFVKEFKAWLKSRSFRDVHRSVPDAPR